MVRFEDEKLVIEISDRTPVDRWLDIHRGICDILHFVTRNALNEDSYCDVIDFLGEITPDYDTAKKMEESVKK